jgi:hypothetical protein
MGSASEHFNRQLAVLAKAVESLSSQLSIALIAGLALVPMLPQRAASTPPAKQAMSVVVAPSIAAQIALPESPATVAPVVVPAKPPMADVEIVKAKPVSAVDAIARGVPAAIAPPARNPSEADEAEAAEAGGLIHLAQRRRDRRQQAALKESGGEMGKAGVPAKTPVPQAAPTEVAKAAPPPEPDQWSDAEVIAALRDCLKRLAPLGAEVEIAPAVKDEQCGAPAPVMLKRFGTGDRRVEFQPPPMLNCAMVASLHGWLEDTVQPAAQEQLGSRITRLRNVSGYACRNRNGTRSGSHRLSEHALANAIDIGSFVTADGRTVDVKRDWGPTVREVRKREIEMAEAKADAAKKERERLEAELKTEWDKLEKDKAALPPPGKTKAARDERQKLQTDLRKREQDLKKREAEADALEETAAREVERSRALERAPMNTSQLSKLGRGDDSRRKAIPVSAPRDEPRLPAEASFLRRLHKGACGPFGTVLGPEANEAHRDHFHLDLAPRKRSAFCE